MRCKTDLLRRLRARAMRVSLAVSVALSVWSLGPTATLAGPTEQPANTAIVYRCGSEFENLCRFTFDGAAPRQLTTDGVPAGPVYTSPSLSADGTKMAFSFGNFAYTADGDAANKVKRSDRTVVFASLRPDGGRLATVEMLLEQAGLACPLVSNPGGFCRIGFYVYGIQFFQRGFVPYLFTYNADGTDKRTERRVPSTFGWYGNRIMSDARYNTETKRAGVCLLVVDDFKCERDLAVEAKRTLVSPAMSPDGSLLAASACADVEPLGNCSIALYAQPGGAFLRNLSSGPNDAAPVWSPDGSMLAFGREQSIWVVGRDGAAGAERPLIEHGMQPTWGALPGGPAPAPAAQPSNGEGPPAPASEPNFADELTDWNVPPQDLLQTRVASRTPMSIPGGQVVSTTDVVRAMGENVPIILIDALAADHAQTIKGALRLPDAGQAGTFDDQVQSDLAAALEAQTEGNLAAALVFFCQGAQCWESYNASLRAINLGYTNVYWYRGGLAAWSEANLPQE